MAGTALASMHRRAAPRRCRVEVRVLGRSKALQSRASFSGGRRLGALLIVLAVVPSAHAVALLPDWAVRVSHSCAGRAKLATEGGSVENGRVVWRYVRARDAGWIVSPRSSMATNVSSRRARVSGFLASWSR